MPKTLNELKEAFDSIQNLPTLPIIAVRLLELLKSENSSIREITEIMSIDPAIAATVLKVANSVLYALPQKVDSLRRAFVVLGTNEIANIVLSISFARAFPWTKNSVYFDRKKFWEHSIVTGYITRLLAKELGLKTHGEEYTAGLIHDIGKLIMDQYFHREFVEALNISAKKRIPNYIAEKMIMGTTHMQLGGMLADKWKLPENLKQAILHHHKPEFADSDMDLCALVCLGDYYTNKLRITPGVGNALSVHASKAFKILRKHSKGFNLSAFRVNLTNEVPKAKQFILMFTRSIG